MRFTEPFLATPVACLLLSFRCAKGKEDPFGLKSEGVLPQFQDLGGNAASVGEAQSALVLIDRLLKDYPKLQILVTTGTVTSAIYLENRLPIRSFHQYLPLDCPHWVSRFQLTGHRYCIC